MMIACLTSNCKENNLKITVNCQQGQNTRTVSPSALSKGSKKRSPNQNHKALEAENMKKGLEKKIEEDNIGYEMLVKMGYQHGQGLGKDGDGMLEPLPLEKKNDRKGLGAPKPNVVREQNGSEGGGVKKKRAKNRRKRSEEEKATVEAEIQARMAHDQANVALKAAEKAKLLAEKAQKVADLLRAKKKEKEKQNALSSKNATIKNSPTPSKTASISRIPEAMELHNPNTSPGNFNATFLKSLLTRFSSEIELLQLQLEAAASISNKSSDDDEHNDLVLAKIFVANERNENISDEDFDFIQSELVGWIGMYQQQNMDTPLFHAMTNNQRHITVVCENTYAYQCLEHCIKDIADIETNISVLRVPSLTPLIYCFEAIYEGVTRDPELFLKQLHLHRPKLHTDCWIVVSHEVCNMKRKTFMIFLVDERSALAMNFQYSSNFCICLQMVTFRNRGVVADTFLN